MRNASFALALVISTVAGAADPPAGTPLGRIRDAVAGRDGMQLVTVSPADVIAVGESIPPGQSTAAIDTIVNGCRRAGAKRKEIHINARDLHELIAAVAPAPVAAVPAPEPERPAGPPVEEPRATPPDPRTGAELAALRAELETLKKQRAAVEKPTATDPDPVSGSWKVLVGLVALGLAIVLLAIALRLRPSAPSTRASSGEATGEWGASTSLPVILPGDKKE